MTALIVSYDLRNPGQDYSGLVAELKSSPGGWWHYLKSTWIIATDETPDELYARLEEHLTAQDRLLVLEVTPSAARQGWLPKKAWTWIDAKIGKPE